MAHKISLGGIGIGVISFYLPWASVTCCGKTVTKTGFEIAKVQGHLGICMTVMIALVVAFVVLKKMGKPAIISWVFIAGAMANLSIAGFTFLDVVRHGVNVGHGLGKIDFHKLNIKMGSGVYWFVLGQLMIVLGSIGWATIFRRRARVSSQSDLHIDA